MLRGDTTTIMASQTESSRVAPPAGQLARHPAMYNLRFWRHRRPALDRVLADSGEACMAAGLTSCLHGARHSGNPSRVYMAWTKRDRLSKIPVQPSGWGVWCSSGVRRRRFSQRQRNGSGSAGVVSDRFGRRDRRGLRLAMVRALMYPLCTLILMIAPPTFIFERLTLGLQLLASRLGEVCLEAMGYSVLRRAMFCSWLESRCRWKRLAAGSVLSWRSSSCA